MSLENVFSAQLHLAWISAQLFEFNLMTHKLIYEVGHCTRNNSDTMLGGGREGDSIPFFLFFISVLGSLLLSRFVLLFLHLISPFFPRPFLPSTIPLFLEP